MSMFSERHKMKTDFGGKFKFNIGDEVEVSKHCGIIESKREWCGRRFYDVRIVSPKPLKHYKRVIETELKIKEK